MPLPDRTLCWVEGPPWDRVCDPVDELFTRDTPTLDVDSFRRRLADLDETELGVVLGLVLSRVDELAEVRPGWSLPELLRTMANQVEQTIAEMS